MDGACLGPLSALQLMEEGSDRRQPPREHAWACCQASFLLLCWQSEKRPALDCPWVGTSLGVPCRWGWSLAGGSADGNPEMALSTLPSGLGQAWGGVQWCLFEPSLGTPWVREACSCPPEQCRTGKVFREVMGRGWTPPHATPRVFHGVWGGRGWSKSLQIPYLVEATPALIV